MTARALLWRLRQIVSGMPIDPGGRRSCQPSYDGTATVTFMTPYADCMFHETAACLSVSAPGGVRLVDDDLSLWQAAARLTGVPVQALP